MGRQHVGHYGFNGGLVDASALVRVDQQRLRLAAETFQNYVPDPQGALVSRPGTEYVASTRTDAYGRLLPLVSTPTAKTLFELTAGKIRFFPAGVLLERGTVATTITNGTFAGSLASWTDDDEAGAVSDYDSGNMRLLGTGTNYARRTQAVTVAVGDQNDEHGLRIVISRGPVLVKIGNSAGGTEYWDTSLGTGEHSLAFTPTTSPIYIRFESLLPRYVLVDFLTIENAGPVALDTPWTTDALLDAVTYDQSGDVMFVACNNVRQRRIERRNNRSFSVVEYKPLDGPFRLPDFSGSITLTPSDVVGDITITASRALFSAGHVGSIWRLEHPKSVATASLGALDATTDYIRVSGIGTQRTINIDVSGTFTATVRLEQAFGVPANFQAVVGGTGATSFTSAMTSTYLDGRDNEIVYYRLRVSAYTSGSATSTVRNDFTSQKGTVLITGYSSATSVSASVLTTLGDTSATALWEEGEWSDVRNYPSSVALYDGRLWWGRFDTLFGSISDAYESFDDQIEGDAGTVIRTVATGGFENILWLLAMERLIAGTASQEITIRSNAFDEPITPTAFTASAPSTRGSAAVQAQRVDSAGIFVQRNRRKVYALSYDVNIQNYGSIDLNPVSRDLLAPRAKRIAVQRQPDTRVWFVLDDGNAAILTYDRVEGVIAWSKIVMTNGLIEDIVCLPSQSDDQVYMIVKRVVDANTVRYVEVLSDFEQAVGGTRNRAMDSAIVYSGPSTGTISGLDHLEGQQVVVWGDGVPLVTTAAPLTVASGAVTLPSNVTDAVVGLPFTCRWQSSRLEYAASLGAAMTKPRRVSRIGVVMQNVTRKSVQVGGTFTKLTEFPKTHAGVILTDTQKVSIMETDIPHAGGWSLDERVCFETISPYSATILALVMDIDVGESVDMTQRRERGGEQ